MGSLVFTELASLLSNQSSLFLLQCGRQLFDLFGAFEILIFDAAIKDALVAFGFAAAQVRFADVRPHQLAAGSYFEPLGGRFVGFDFWHRHSSIFDSGFWIFDSHAWRAGRGWGKRRGIVLPPAIKNRKSEICNK